jgi:hypothetical protein
MVAIGISEFTFGFSFLYEQTRRNWQQLRAAPVLPSLQQEADDAWDARLPLIGTDYYYQFKLSDYLFRTNANYIRDGTYSEAYYRIALHRRENNRQHRRLKEHTHSHPNTYYVAPEFNNLDDFNSAFLSSQITERSRLIPIAECDDITDGGQHFITFQEGNVIWRQHSVKKSHEKSFSGRDIELLYRSTSQTWRKIDSGFAASLFEKTMMNVRILIEQEDRRIKQTIFPLLDFNPQNQSRANILVRTSQILSVFFGLTLVIVGQTR